MSKLVRFSKVPHVLVSCSSVLGISPKEGWLIVALMYRIREGATSCHPSQDLLAVDTRMGLRTVKEALRSLKNKGYITITTKKSDRGYSYNVYDLAPLFRQFEILNRLDDKERQQLNHAAASKKPRRTRSQKPQRSPETDLPRTKPRLRPDFSHQLRDRINYDVVKAIVKETFEFNVTNEEIQVELEMLAAFDDSIKPTDFVLAAMIATSLGVRRRCREPGQTSVDYLPSGRMGMSPGEEAEARRAAKQRLDEARSFEDLN